METPAMHFQPIPQPQRGLLRVWAPPELTGLPDLGHDPDSDLEP